MYYLLGNHYLLNSLLVLKICLMVLYSYSGYTEETYKREVLERLSRYDPTP